MGYCTAQDVLALIGERALQDLVDDTDPRQGEVSYLGGRPKDALAAAMAAADREIDAHVAAVAPVPLRQVPSLIRLTAAKLTVRNLYARRPQLDAKRWEDEYARCLRLLERIAAGKVPLGATPGAPVQAEPAAGVTVAAPPPLFGDLGGRY